MASTDRHRTDVDVIEGLLRYATAASTFAFLIGTIHCLIQSRSCVRIFQHSRAYTSVSILNFTISLSYVCRVIEWFHRNAPGSQSVLVYDLSQLLLWVTLSLAFLSAKRPPTTPYLITSVLCLVLQVILSINFAQASKDAWKESSISFSLEVLTCILLLALATGLSTTLHNIKSDGTSEERESLLSKNHSSSSSSTFSSDVDDTDDSGDESDKEEEELKKSTQARLQSKGGLSSYLLAFKVFLPHLIPYRDVRMQIYVVILLLNTLAQRAVNVLQPIQLGIIIDKLTSIHQIPWTNVALWITFRSLGAEMGLETLSEFPLARLLSWSMQRLNVASFEQVMNLSMSFHDNKDSGEVIKAIEQADSLSELFKLLILEIAPCILDIFIAMWYITHLFDVYAMLMVIAVCVSFTFAAFWISKLVAVRKRNFARAERQESRVLYETVSNWPTITFFNRKTHERNRLAKVCNEKVTAEYLANDAYTILFAAQEACELTGRFAISILALYRVTTGMSSIGDFVALQSYWDTITLPLYILGRSYREFSSNLINAERLLQLFETKVAVMDAPNAKPIAKRANEIKFSDVSFSYDKLRRVLSDLSFTVQPGQTIGVVGETGSGKSTTLKLLMRLYDVTSGSISINGQDLRDIQQDSLRDLFGVVPQDTFLFNTNIMENVRYGRLNATDEEVMQACQAACIHDKITSFPQAYRSQVGERGVKLSGGERQRLAIARVLLRDSPIILLDEATSAMDSATEAKIQQALKTLMKGRTSFIIAHRLSTVAEADTILVIDQGRLVEQGTPAELLQKKGRYFELWMKQQGNKSDNEQGEGGSATESGDESEGESGEE